VAARILHLSDVHVGKGDPAEILDGLVELAGELRPELVLATGDLSNRGQLEQLRSARALLDRIGLPVLAVPGNHDIPYTLPARFTRTFDRWETVFDGVEPVFRSDALLVVGLNSVRPWRQQGGALTQDALGRAAAALVDAPDGALRVVALHHQLAAPPWRAARKRPLRHRDQVLAALADAGVELIAGGHVHQASVSERREFQALEDGGRRTVVLATVPGLGRPRPRRSGEARGVNVYEADASTLAVVTLAWDGRRFAEVARRTFARG
jgi:3',5'-cyclic AMP phosphodiesterase CpdA